MGLELTDREITACLLLAVLTTAIGVMLLVWEQARWRRCRRDESLDEFERSHERWRVIRRTAIAMVLVLGGPALAIGWLTIDAAQNRRAFVGFWTAALAVLLALILMGLLDALIMVRFGLKQSARLYEQRVDTLTEFVRQHRQERLRKRPWPPPPTDAEQN